MSLVTRTAECLRRNDVLRRGAHILVAVSGGCDSTVLAHVLAALRKPWDLRLTFVYVHHGLRKEADAEVVFVRGFAADAGADFRLCTIDVRNASEAGRRSVQDVARRLRYEALEGLRGELKADIILTAHHADDQAETLLARFLRGSGVAGLSGIRPQMEYVFRPFLNESRAEIETYAREQGIAWMHDVSNDSDAYDRNRLRHHVIPAVRSYAGASWPGVMVDSARLFQALDAFLAHHVDRLAGECLEEQHDAVVLAVQPLKRYFEFEQLSLLRHALTRLRGSEGMFDEVFSLKHLIDAEPGKRAVLRGGVIAFRESSRIIVRMPATETDPQRVAPDGRFRHGTAVFTIERCDRAAVRIHRDPAEEYIDLTRTGEKLLLRAWTSDDVFTPLGFGAEKRVGVFLADRGIPRHRRVRIPVLAGGDGIVWVCGVRLDEHARIRDESTDIARIRYSISSDAS